MIKVTAYNHHILPFARLPMARKGFGNEEKCFIDSETQAIRYEWNTWFCITSSSYTNETITLNATPRNKILKIKMRERRRCAATAALQTTNRRTEGKNICATVIIVIFKISGMEAESVLNDFFLELFLHCVHVYIHAIRRRAKRKNDTKNRRKKRFLIETPCTHSHTDTNLQSGQIVLVCRGEQLSRALFQRCLAQWKCCIYLRYTVLPPFMIDCLFVVRPVEQNAMAY